jgi:hypothetical protein
MPTGDLDIILSGSDPSAFVLSTANANSIPIKGSDSFTIIPKDDLLPGTYTAVVKVGPSASNTTFLGEESFSVSFTVEKLDSSVLLVSSTGVSQLGTMVDFSATVTSSVGTPAGMVEFYDGIVLLGSAALIAGTATFSTDSLDVGNHSITASYLGNEIYLSSDSDVVQVEVEVIPVIDSAHVYYIKATSDSWSVITPEGVYKAYYGQNVKFSFHAVEGYVISEVKVNGVPLSKEQIGLGYYVFSDLKANHTIDVRSKTDLTPGGSEKPSTGQSEIEEASSNDNPILFWMIFVIIIVGIMFFFIFYRRRSYNVAILGNASMKMIGKEKARRKREYRFKIDGLTTGSVSYRVGNNENSPWKAVLPDKDMNFVIPKKDVVSDITIQFN